MAVKFNNLTVLLICHQRKEEVVLMNDSFNPSAVAPLFPME